ncbi:MAG: hypothetical protein INR69_06540 [Mucilaginibacter polytrichastri]|nr:hypothetical protein [Mucilaginibacter polytrichastri]
MKKMNHFVATAALMLMFICTAGRGYAQTDSRGSLRLGIGIEAGAPTQNYTNLMLGGTAKLQYDLASSTSLTLTSGYYNLFTKNLPVADVTGGAKTQDIGIVPLKLGAKIFVAPNVYIHPEAGAAFSVRDRQEGKFAYYQKGAMLDAAAGIGYASDSGLDFSIRYEQFFKNESKNLQSLGFVALRVAYAFKLL